MPVRKVMIVEDDPLIRQLIAMTIQAMRTDIEVRSHSDGAEAIKSLTQNPDVDLILCDVLMPHVDGVRLAQWAAGIPALQSVRFVMLTSVSREQIDQRINWRNVVGYIRKPILPRELQESLRAIFELVDAMTES